MAKHWLSISLMLALAVAASFGGNYAVLSDSSPQAISVTASFEGKRVAPRQQLEFTLSRRLSAGEGRVALLVGATDISHLLLSKDHSVGYNPGVLPLPAGESQVKVYVVSTNNSWTQVAQFLLRVEPSQSLSSSSKPSEQLQQSSSDGSADGNGASPNPTPAATGGRRWGFDKAILTPSLTVGLKSQMAESHFPDSSRPLRQTFADTTLQFGIRSEVARGSFSSQTQFDIVGSSFRQEALRFAQEGITAPRVDLSSYLMQFGVGRARFNVGHIAVGTNRHLINSFSSRGVSLTVPITNRADFSLAGMNGTSIVGWNNFLGLNQSKHQIVAGTLGFELSPGRPGGLRLEASMLDGRVLPISNFNQGNITDAERSRGAGFRVLASDKDQRLRIDGGLARSSFTNPADSQLFQDRAVVPVREVTRYARYIDASYSPLQNVAIGETRKATLTMNYRHERIDPLFRSVASFTQADRAQNQIEMVAAIGEVIATFSHLRFSDNLDNIPSVLTSLSRRSNLIVGAPLSSLIGSPTQPAPWLPRVSFSFDEMRQFAASAPVGGGFESPSTVPDQVSRNSSLTADWQFSRVRLGYRFNRSFQDNRQPGRELADLRNLMHTLSVGLNPTRTFDLNFDVSAESALNRESRREDGTIRIGPNLTWRISERMTVSAMMSYSAAGDLAETNKNRSAEIDTQWSYRFGIERSRMKRLQGNLFVRYANRYASSRDSIFGFDSLTRLQTLNAGVSFTFF